MTPINLKHTYILFVLTIGFQSCTQELKLFSNGPSSPVVYCILDPSQTIQFLRIGRSYIYEGDGSNYSPPSDSLILTDEFYAYLEEILPDGTHQIHYFEKSESPLRDEGFFTQSELCLLQVDCNIQYGHTYMLYVYFPDLDRIVSGQTTVVEPFTILDPIPIPGREITLNEDQGYYLRWTCSRAYNVYESIIRLNILEGNADFQFLKQLDIKQELVYNTAATEKINSFVNTGNFVQNLASQLQVSSDTLQRKIIGFDFILIAGGEELAHFSKNKELGYNSFSGLNEYSNLDGAMGVFSSRISLATYNNRFSDLSINYLADHPDLKPFRLLHDEEEF